MFGYARGAFTGANTSGRPGAFIRAANGTIVLDEIGDMPYHLQPKLLRVIEDKQIKKLGSDEHESLGKIKIVASTNKDLAALVREQKFRDDLFHRLTVLTLYMPTLVERGADDIRALVKYFATGDINSDLVSEDVLEAVAGMALPGNVRTLEHLVQRAKVLGFGMVTNTLISDAMPQLQLEEVAVSPSYNRGNVVIQPPSIYNLQILKMWAISASLAVTNGCQKEAADLLGISPRVLNYWLDKLKARPKDDKSAGLAEEGKVNDE